MSDRNKSTSFLAQAFILAGAGLFVKIIGFWYKLYITNMLQDEGMGIYMAGYNIYNFFLVLSSAGLPAAISKMVSKRIALKNYRNAHRVFKVSLVVATSAGLVSALILYFGAGYLSRLILSPDSYYALKTLAPTVFIVAIMSVFRGYFQGMNNTVPTSLSQIVEQIFNAVFSIYLVYIYYEQSLAFAAAGGTAATGIGAFAGLLVILGIYFMAKGRIRRRMGRDKGEARPEAASFIAKELLFTAFPIIAGTAVYSMTSIIDTNMVKARLMLNGVFDEVQATELFGQLTGKYVTITNLPVAIAASMATAIIPSIAASVALNDFRATTHKVNLAIRLAMVISIPSAFGIGVFSEQIIEMLYPNAQTGGQLLKYGALSIIFFALAQISTGVLQGIGKLHIPVVSAFIGCIAKIIVNYIFIAIPSINIIGAIIGTTVCYIISSGANTYFAFKYTDSRPDLVGVFLKPTLSSIIMAMVCYVFYYTILYLYPSNSVALILSIGAGMGVYFIAMVILGGITKSDLNMIPMGKKLASLITWLGL